MIDDDTVDSDRLINRCFFGYNVKPNVNCRWWLELNLQINWLFICPHKIANDQIFCSQTIQQAVACWIQINLKAIYFVFNIIDVEVINQYYRMIKSCFPFLSISRYNASIN